MFTIYFFREKIEFIDLENWKRVATKITKEKKEEFSLICTSSPSTLWYTSYSTGNNDNTAHLVQLDCSSSPVQVKHTFEINLYHKGWTKDMCFVNDGNKALVVVAQSFKGLTAYNTETGQIEWSVTGRLKNGRYRVSRSQNSKGIWFTAVTANARGHVLVVDRRSGSMYMFSSEGEYLVYLNKPGCLNLQEVRVVRWCQKTSSFMASHRELRSNRDTITYFTALRG